MRDLSIYLINAVIWEKEVEMCVFTFVIISAKVRLVCCVGDVGKMIHIGHTLLDACI